MCQINVIVIVMVQQKYSVLGFFHKIFFFLIFNKKSLVLSLAASSRELYWLLRRTCMRTLNNEWDLKKKIKGEESQNEMCISKEYLQLKLNSCSVLLVQAQDFTSLPAIALSTKLFLPQTNVYVLKYCGMHAIWPVVSLS